MHFENNKNNQHCQVLLYARFSAECFLLIISLDSHNMQDGNCYSYFIDEGFSLKEVRSLSQERAHNEKMMRPVLRTTRLYTTHSTYATTSGSRDYYPSHFTDKETGPERSSKLPEATQLETRFRPR